MLLIYITHIIFLLLVILSLFATIKGVLEMSGYYDKIMHWGRRKGIVNWYKEKKIRIKEILKMKENMGKIGIRGTYDAFVRGKEDFIMMEEKIWQFCIKRKILLK